VSENQAGRVWGEIKIWRKLSDRKEDNQILDFKTSFNRSYEPNFAKGV